MPANTLRDHGLSGPYRPTLRTWTWRKRMAHPTIMRSPQFYVCVHIVYEYVYVRQPSFLSTRSGDNSSSSAISRNSTGSSGSHQPRDLDLPAKRFTLVNPGISGYHSGSRSRD
ncbi:hypothetical protein ANTRET_LOCUS10042 [Anthophora retusa]